jgi:hypothetical protein
MQEINERFLARLYMQTVRDHTREEIEMILASYKKRAGTLSLAHRLLELAFLRELLERELLGEPVPFNIEDYALPEEGDEWKDGAE